MQESIRECVRDRVRENERVRESKWAKQQIM